MLVNYHFPGNVRELENLVERCSVLGNSVITEEGLPHQVRHAARSIGATDAEVAIPSEGWT